MRITYLIAFTWLFCFVGLSANPKDKLGENEIKSSKKINFYNRSNTKADKSIIKKNIKVGRELALQISQNPEKQASSDSFFIVRLTPIEEKLGADIITIGDDVDYGHIHSLIRVLKSYIQKSFEYSEEDSEVIARYILYYNAFHRLDKNYFVSKFNPHINEAIDPKTVGIATDYQNWPGKTQLVIPIESLGGGTRKDIPLNELETEVNKITDKNKNREEDRKKFEDIIKRKEEEKKQPEVVEKKETTPPITKKIDEEPKNKEPEVVKKENEDLKKKVDVVENTNKKLDKENTDLKKKVDVVENTNKKLDKENTDLKKKAESTDKENTDLKKKVEKVENTNKDLTVENEKVRKENKELKNENEVVKNENRETKEDNSKLKKDLEEAQNRESNKGRFSENVIGGKIYFMKVIQYVPQSGRYHNEIYMIDPDKDDIVIKGDYTNICGKTFQEFGKYILSVGCEDSVYKFVLLNKYTLKFEFKSETEAYIDSPLLVDNGKIELLAIEAVDDKYYLSRFDKTLKRLNRSEVEVSPYSRITMYGEKIYLTSKEESGKSSAILVLQKKDLKLVKRIQQP